MWKKKETNLEKVCKGCGKVFMQNPDPQKRRLKCDSCKNLENKASYARKKKKMEELGLPTAAYNKDDGHRFLTTWGDAGIFC